MTTEIKVATVADAEALQDLSITAYRDTFDEFNTTENMQAYLEDAYNLPKITRELQTSDTQFLLLNKDQQLAGYIKLNINQAQTEDVDPLALEVERLYIHPNFKYHGLGSQLMQLALDTAQTAGKTQVWLGVWEHNEPAQKFYHKWGFERFSQHDFYMGDDRQTDYLMTHRF
ncbi:GNAT family N-acetyltransferase [Lactiplantibacillus herbarum]|uniref:GNAT family N-acetyltransferase n=1 Tax=Lactiplantibacillus herbarum TaxID=1670446 RepID=UPI00064F054D|nr:GNAT family N-acetyltransferase [Lactiplantibacillus herbarum]